MREAIEARVAAAGWPVGDADALIILADARGGIAEVAAHDGEALETRAALVALVDDDREADAAYGAGATHALDAAGDTAEWVRVLRFASRFGRRLRGQSHVRRSDDRATQDVVAAALDRRIAETGEAMAVLVALTRFEVVNAAFGRVTGDALLAAAAHRIAQELPREATIGRAGGASFAIAATTDHHAVERIERALTRPFDIAGTAINVGVRIGIADGAAGEGGAPLLRRATEALVAGGRDAQAVVVDPSHPMPTERLAADLHHALERDEIVLLFQPQVAMATGTITGVEALARWRHPVAGTLGAERLFAAADRAGLTAALSDHILTLALAHAAAWPAGLSTLRLAINVTAQDLARPDFASRLIDRVTRHGIAPGRITLEITESGLIDNLAQAAGVLAQVRGAGCRVAIDDFGTGYSSLAYLKALPLDYLKIDSRLTQDIAGSGRDRVVVRGVIAMARSLGLETIVEGVETEAQRALLAAEECDYYQGFLCAPPLDDAALVRLVKG